MTYLRVMLAGVAAAAIASIAAPSGHLPQDGPSFQTGIVGSAPRGRSHPVTALADPSVRSLIVGIAGSPMTIEAARDRLAGVAYDIEDLVRLGLLSLKDGRARLAFNYLSADDQRRIASRAAEDARDLARRILRQRSAIERAASGLGHTPEDRRQALFFILGCVALDWDGLAFTERRGYRIGATVTGDGFAYTPWMKEDATGLPRRGLYWGSHNAAAGAFTFTTFGDHHSLPRRALPDLASIQAPPAALSALADALVGLREGAVAKQDEPAISYLAELGYVRPAGGRMTVAIPVLTADAHAAVAEIVGLVRAEVEAWHADRYPAIAKDLADLTPGRHGVPFTVVYTEIWHYVFGYTNLYLSEAGLVADPYAPDARFAGFVPVLWHSSLRR